MNAVMYSVESFFLIITIILNRRETFKFVKLVAVWLCNVASKGELKESMFTTEQATTPPPSRRRMLVSLVTN